MKSKFNLTAGKKYQIFNNKWNNSSGLFTSCPIYEFEKCVPCYDARFHGAGNPSDYIVYLFRLPEKQGQFSLFQSEIIDIKEIA